MGVRRLHVQAPYVSKGASDKLTLQRCEIQEHEQLHNTLAIQKMKMVEDFHVFLIDFKMSGSKNIFKLHAFS